MVSQPTKLIFYEVSAHREKFLHSLHTNLRLYSDPDPSILRMLYSTEEGKSYFFPVTMSGGNYERP